MSDLSARLVPPPQDVRETTGRIDVPRTLPLAVPDVIVDRPAFRRLAGELSRAGHEVITDAPAGRAWLELRLGDEEGPAAQGYELRLAETAPRRLVAGGLDGMLYGLATLAHWLRLHRDENGREREELRPLMVADRPDIAVRGLMLDVSRNKVPSLETLRDIADLLADWKMNQLQLYTEHTFAYAGHEEVWRDASPLTAADIRQLDRYCAERGIELVPNQNSFGHLHRWLVHPRYRPLAECPEGIEHPFSQAAEPFSLCPLDPAALELLADLYSQLLPCFSSGLFNVGLDETFDLGRGRSADACARRGRETVYLDFLQRVHGLVAAGGRRMMFWADVLLESPERARDVPEDAIGLIWGYEADHDFDGPARALSDAGLDFYVCPGTSSWNSLAGRLDNALPNLAAAARAAVEHGASGYLVTDWGDNGHLQPLAVSLPALLAGACFGWNAATAAAADALALPTLLDEGPLHDLRAGESLCRLGTLHAGTGGRLRNGNVPFRLLVSAGDPLTRRGLERLDPSVLEGTAARAAAEREVIAALPGHRPAAARLRGELDWAARALELACRLGAERIRHGATEDLSDLPASVRAELAGTVRALGERLRGVWLLRNRSGGLDDSVARLGSVAALLDDPRGGRLRA